MSAVLAERQLTDTERLAMAREAYLLADGADQNIRRISRYKRMTPGMKTDLARYRATYAQNRELHDKIMRGLL